MDGTKQFYDVRCTIRVEANDDDAALFWIKDMCNLYPDTEFKQWHQINWVDTTTIEGESNE